MSIIEVQFQHNGKDFTLYFYDSQVWLRNEQNENICCCDVSDPGWIYEFVETIHQLTGSSNPAFDEGLYVKLKVIGAMR